MKNLRMSEPVCVRVRSDEHGMPLLIQGEQIELVRESWLVEDRWWTGRPLRRRYWELVSVRGRNAVSHDLCSGEWFRAEGMRHGKRALTWELHCHSAFSFLDGASQPEELAARAG